MMKNSCVREIYTSTSMVHSMLREHLKDHHYLVQSNIRFFITITLFNQIFDSFEQRQLLIKLSHKLHGVLTLLNPPHPPTPLTPPPPPPLSFITTDTPTVAKFISQLGDTGPWPLKWSELSGCWQMHRYYIHNKYFVKKLTTLSFNQKSFKRNCSYEKNYPA